MRNEEEGEREIERMGQLGKRKAEQAGRRMKGCDREECGKMERLRLSVIKEERKNGIFCREREMEDLLWGFREGQALSCLLLFHNQFSFFSLPLSPSIS